VDDQPGTDQTRLHERRVLFFTCVAHAFTHVYMVVYSVVPGPIGRDLGLDLGEFMGYAAIASVLFGVGALPAGWLSDHLGQKPLLVAFFLVTAAGGTILGLAQNTAQLAVGMACLGIGASVFHPVGNSMIARGIRSPARAMGTNGFWGSAGEAAGPLFAGVVAQFLSWRWAYLGLTLPMVACGVWLLLTPLHLPPREPPSPPSGKRRPFPVLLGLLFVTMAVAGVQFWLIKTILPTHIQERTQVFWLLSDDALLRAGLLTAFVYAVGGFGQYLTGRCLEHVAAWKLYVAVFALGVPLVALVSGAAGVPLVLAAAVMSVILFAPQPIENSLLAAMAPARWKGLVFGMKFVLTFGVGGLGTYLSGRVAEAQGTGAVFYTAIAFLSLALALATVTMVVARGRHDLRR
jgi:MFS family permease